jgi:hypothetical protein
LDLALPAAFGEVAAGSFACAYIAAGKPKIRIVKTAKKQLAFLIKNTY